MENNYLRVKETLKNKILFGSYHINEKLPTENELMQYFSVSRYTIRKTLANLESEHLIYRIQGAGIFVEDWNKKWNAHVDSKTIGIICTHIASYIFPQIISQIDTILSKEGYSILISSTHNNTVSERNCLINMLDSHVAGLIIEPSQSALPNPNLDIYRTIKQNNIPALFLNAEYPELTFPSITNADSEAEKEVVQYLLDLGHEKILGIFQTSDLQGVYRMQGFIAAYQEYRADSSKSNIIMYRSSDDIKTIIEKMELYLKSTNRPTAIVCYHDKIAIKIMDYLKNTGYSIPGDISIVGFDNYELSKYLTPTLTTLNYDTISIGKEAGHGILQLINTKKFDSIIHKPQLIKGSSTARI
ncbi:GntR family transcriptional regulator [Ligilactobacillus sp. WILCCON 0076]|uniref:GntR family transcriptional regulator n=1 Tax=Ligilactobacillus ubinensis TaxID=2876789 RepID=A0A9X2FKT1_9LACO|nr:GntR family transcriptional regulator [Ligilactobacillus ubinensis]MCP0887034.1 GntR family transcriptional regulator [Ligilactobacillus ubinensis]